MRCRKIKIEEPNKKKTNEKEDEDDDGGRKSTHNRCMGFKCAVSRRVLRLNRRSIATIGAVFFLIAPMLLFNLFFLSLFFHLLSSWSARSWLLHRMPLHSNTRKTVFSLLVLLFVLCSLFSFNLCNDFLLFFCFVLVFFSSQFFVTRLVTIFVRV